MSVLQQRLNFQMFYFMQNDHKTIVKYTWGSAAAVSSAVGSWQSLRGGSWVKALKNFSLTSRGQTNSLKWKKPSKLVYFEGKFDNSLFLYASK